MSAEDWRPIPDFPGYFVSDRGRVVSHKGGGTYELVGQKRNGYRQVLLNDHGRRRMCKVHILVAEAFIGPRPAGMDVCHNDGDSLHNAVSNLRYDTRKANVADSLRHGTHPQASKTHCPASHPYDEANTRHTPSGRKCRTCERERQQAARDMQVYLAAKAS